MDATFPRLAHATTIPGVATKSEAVDLRFSPDATLLWTYGRLVYADDVLAPRPSRLMGALLRLRGKVWYEWLRQPRVTREDRPVIHERRAQRFTREEARRLCRDKMDFISGFPLDAEPFGEEIILNPTLCRPHWKPHKERDAEHGRAYTTDARAQVCGALAAENVELKSRLKEYERLTARAENFIAKTNRLL